MIHADGDTVGNRPWVIEAVFELWKLYYNSCGNPTGGYLHICTDDENLEDGDLKWCINEARTHRDHIGVALGECLLELTVKERETLYKDFWDSEHKR